MLECSKNKWFQEAAAAQSFYGLYGIVHEGTTTICMQAQNHSSQM